MFYDKQIKYVDVYEKGEKIQNAGFVKLEARDNMVSLQVRVTGLRTTDTYTCPVALLSGEKECIIGELQMENGKGVKIFEMSDKMNLGGQIGYEELEEIQIRTAGNRMLRCIVRERVKKIEEPAVEEEVLEEPAVKQEVLGEPAVIADPITVKSEAELLKEAFLEEKRMREAENTDTTSGETAVQKQVFLGNEAEWQIPVSSVSSNTEPQNVHSPQAADKWQQLQAIYPHIRPFEDRREYLLMRPQDFVILPQKYYSLSDNSFLLHGYYNYDHLILSKENRPEGEKLYIGVPGNFYDKEKQVAIMFGFESFEGKQEPARIGDFGYYMIPVEI